MVEPCCVHFLPFGRSIDRLIVSTLYINSLRTPIENRIHCARRRGKNSQPTICLYAQHPKINIFRVAIHITAICLPMPCRQILWPHDKTAFRVNNNRFIALTSRSLCIFDFIFASFVSRTMCVCLLRQSHYFLLLLPVTMSLLLFCVCVVVMRSCSSQICLFFSIVAPTHTFRRETREKKTSSNIHVTPIGGDSARKCCFGHCLLFKSFILSNQSAIQRRSLIP